MCNITFENKIKDSSYPGRGIVIGMTPDKKNYVQVYWIMGRSENSRNRVFEEENQNVRTKAFDESKLEDPSLIIYYPSRTLDNYHIITNGDQTDTVYDYLKEGKSFKQGLNTRCFEPDGPNYTPRISGLIDFKTKEYKLSILKTIDNNEENELKVYFDYLNFIPGIGHCITTYNDDGNPLPSFTGEPYKVELLNDIDENLEKFWTLLDNDNKVSMLVKYIDVTNNKQTIKIKNKNLGD